MVALADHKHAALLLALTLTEGNTNDMEREYVRGLITIPPTAEFLTVDDLWHAFFDDALIGPGDFNDRAYEWLATKLQTQPALNERWFGYWASLSGL